MLRLARHLLVHAEVGLGAARLEAEKPPLLLPITRLTELEDLGQSVEQGLQVNAGDGGVEILEVSRGLLDGGSKRVNSEECTENGDNCCLCFGYSGRLGFIRRTDDDSRLSVGGSAGGQGPTDGLLRSLVVFIRGGLGGSSGSSSLCGDERGKEEQGREGKGGGREGGREGG